MIANFRTGVYRNGDLVMSPVFVAKLYNWFPILRTPGILDVTYGKKLAAQELAKWISQLRGAEQFPVPDDVDLRRPLPAQDGAHLHEVISAFAGHAGR